MVLRVWGESGGTGMGAAGSVKAAVRLYWRMRQVGRCLARVARACSASEPGEREFLRRAGDAKLGVQPSVKEEESWDLNGCVTADQAGSHVLTVH